MFSQEEAFDFIALYFLPYGRIVRTKLFILVSNHQASRISFGTIGQKSVSRLRVTSNCKCRRHSNSSLMTIILNYNFVSDSDHTHKQPSKASCHRHTFRHMMPTSYVHCSHNKVSASQNVFCPLISTLRPSKDTMH